jgi:hypothetical protein
MASKNIVRAYKCVRAPKSLQCFTRLQNRQSQSGSRQCLLLRRRISKSSSGGYNERYSVVRRGYKTQNPRLDYGMETKKVFYAYDVVDHQIPLTHTYIRNLENYTRAR